METSNENLNETQLFGREGVYQLVTQAEYCRPKVGGISSYAGPNSMLVGGGAASNTGSGHAGQDGAAAGGASSANSGAGSIAGTSGATNQGGGGVPLVPIKISFTKVATMMINPGASPITSTTSTFAKEGAARQSHSMGELEAIDAVTKVNFSPEKGNVGDGAHRHHGSLGEDRPQHQQERIIINIGRELFVFNFNGIEPADLSKLIDRRVYKLTVPTCHDVSTCPSLSLILIGFSSGQVQLLDLNQADVNKFYNQERFIEKSRVTCVRWLPRSKANFLVSHASGQMYLYKEDLTCGNAAPTYQHYKHGPGFAIYSCKSKSQRNPIFRWSIGINKGAVVAAGATSTLNGSGGAVPNNGVYEANLSSNPGGGSGGGQMNAINEFAFSPCGNFLAVVSQDGFLRVFDYDQMDLVGTMRSYFGGLLCLAWSSDSRLIATGGEDDLITIWSVAERRVLARGQGHKSWVNAVAFDAYMTSFSGGSMINGKDKLKEANETKDEDEDDDDLDEDTLVSSQHEPIRSNGHQRRGSLPIGNGDFYRLGSVGQDTQICLWDITEDIIGPSIQSPLLIGCRANRMNAQIWASDSKRQSLSNISETSDKSSSAATDKTICSATSATKLNQNGSTANLLAGEASSSSPVLSPTPPAKDEKGKKGFFFKVGSSKTLEKPHKSSILSTALSSRSFSDHHNKRATASHSKATGEAAAAAAAAATVAGCAPTGPPRLNLNDATRLLGTPLCPRLDGVPMIEPHVAKKVAHERLTSIVFRREAIVIGNQDGRVMVFARPKQDTR